MHPPARSDPEGSPSSLVPRSSGFDFVRDIIHLINIIIVVNINNRKTLFTAYALSAQDDSAGKYAPRKSFALQRGEWRSRRNVCNSVGERLPATFVKLTRKEWRTRLYHAAARFRQNHEKCRAKAL